MFATVMLSLIQSHVALTRHFLGNAGYGGGEVRLQARRILSISLRDAGKAKSCKGLTRAERNDGSDARAADCEFVFDYGKAGHSCSFHGIRNCSPINACEGGEGCAGHRVERSIKRGRIQAGKQHPAKSSAVRGHLARQFDVVTNVRWRCFLCEQSDHTCGIGHAQQNGLASLGRQRRHHGGSDTKDPPVPGETIAADHVIQTVSVIIVFTHQVPALVKGSKQTKRAAFGQLQPTSDLAERQTITPGRK